ncbi:hypothetical protein GAO09_10220 [Rhizobiales bacterium RZME27]|uniref:Uncharacterized protein n=1 Tax=Endobacterium cereale TaxID=2663029 RepID=A0A6A8A9X0_9HYPH|nr:hypothetical protein [Endobacterium cereale]MEB2846656.1 hypothetical protein [Endobacterium cereale]MQY46420.1 hypothetical protein [Endobacterium cereale]
MRTPWKMLADLVSGKSSKDETEAAPQPDVDKAKPAATGANKTVADADTALALVENTVDTLSEPVIAPEPETINSQPSVVDTKTATVTTPVDRPLATEEKPVSVASSATRAKSNEPVVSPRVEEAAVPVKAKRFAATRQKREIAVSAEEPAQTAKPVLKSATDEMADLDREIEELRKQLAEKLKLQNAHLRKLIDRYESR